MYNKLVRGGLLWRIKAFVLGMARSGYEAAKLLASKGYNVIINDLNKEQRKDHIKELESLGVKLVWEVILRIFLTIPLRCWLRTRYTQ